MRAHDLIGRRAYDHTGRYLGRVVDLVTELDPAGVPRVVAIVVSPHWHGRLLGYERPEAHGPWLIEQIAKLLSRRTRTVAWDEVRLS